MLLITNKKYKKYNNRIIRGSGVMLYKLCNDIILILCVLGRESGKWGFPKGSFKENESLEECACRELKEETGLILKKDIFKLKRKIGSHIYFSVEYTGLMKINIQDTKEIQNAKWFRLKELYKMHDKLKNNALRFYCDSVCG